MFVLFEHLAERNIPPFSSQRVGYIEEPRKPNWDRLPPELEYLIPVAEKYGVYYTEHDILSFLEKASEPDKEELARTAEKIHLNDHMKLIDEWIDRYPFTEHHESWLVYSLLLMLDHAGLL